MRVSALTCCICALILVCCLAGCAEAEALPRGAVLQRWQRLRPRQQVRHLRLRAAASCRIHGAAKRLQDGHIGCRRPRQHSGGGMAAALCV